MSDDGINNLIVRMPSMIDVTWYAKSNVRVTETQNSMFVHIIDHYEY